jgi:L-fucose mutarotase
MLRGVPPLLTPDLLHALAAMGHGDRIAIVDSNFPAARVARRLVELPGADASAVLEAVLTLMPLEDAEQELPQVMQVVGDPHAVPEAVRDFRAVLSRHGYGAVEGLERHSFYRAAAETFMLVRTGERRFYGNILLTMGVLPA